MALHNKIDSRLLKEKMQSASEDRTTISFYKYHHIGNPYDFRNELYKNFETLKVMGRVYVASEGVNAQISVLSAKLDEFKNYLGSISFLRGVRLNTAVQDNGKSFFKLKILVRKKIVADGLNDSTFDVTDQGVHVNAVEFNRLSSDPDTVIVDMRNHYESEVGHFINAIRPDVDTFREELQVVEDLMKEQKDKNLLMYCTGGIRCEKASAWMKHLGFKIFFSSTAASLNMLRKLKSLGLKTGSSEKISCLMRGLANASQMTSLRCAISVANPVTITQIVRTTGVTFYSFSV